MFLIRFRVRVPSTLDYQPPAVDDYREEHREVRHKRRDTSRAEHVDRQERRDRADGPALEPVLGSSKDHRIQV